MDFSNIKLSIGIVIAIIAQAFGIIWYVAQLDSTVGNLSTTVDVIQEEKTTVDVAVLQNDIEALKDKIAMTQEMARMYTVGKEFDSSDLEEAIEEIEDELADLKTRNALIENEMRTIMSDHMGFNKVLEDMGKSGYGDNRQYGDYDD
jgi:methylthioribose-1-phosphate isomerase|tara:strand:- start:975 stop:1415 length:441 start_codon:yes stop_codon:yes gene_type:complete